ncbi:MAG: D-glycerate dehydrogenase [Phycisphaeraceae bacterium]
MPLPRVIVHDLPEPVGETLLRGSVEILPWELALRGETNAEGIYMFGHERIDGPLMDRLPALKVISNCGVGVDHIDVVAAKERGIKVGNTPGVLDETVADIAFALLLMAARRLGEGVRYARSEAFTEVKHNTMLGRDAHHATLGIVGLGSIGAQIAKRARAFDMEILYHNRSRNPAAEAAYGAQYVTLDELLAESDYVMLMVPLTEKTRGLINAKTLAKMKRTATLINMSRGPVVDTAALTKKMQAKRIYHAALDVTDPEPLPRDHPLLSMDNVTITPHLGSATVQTRLKMAEISTENLLRGLRGEELVHEV